MNNDQATDLARDEGVVSWRSIGAVVAGLADRIEAARFEADRIEEPDYVPVAWAAE
jgi:nitrate reductase assembly molybdenum cofactor insertion protein NarJ